MCYASGLFFYSVEGSINKWYFALKDTWTPNWVGALWALGHLTISIVGGLYTPLGLAAVALAYPISKDRQGDHALPAAAPAVGDACRRGRCGPSSASCCCRAR